MDLDEVMVSRAIVDSFTRDFRDALDTDVVVVGAGPSGMTAAYYLARAGVRTVLFERSLRLGGGMPGGGMMYNRIVVQQAACEILEELGIQIEQYEGLYYTASALEATSALAYQAIKQGTRIFNLIGAEDVMVKHGQVSGLVVNWHAVNLGRLHVDPLTVKCGAVVDATGHACEVIKCLLQRPSLHLTTPGKTIVGEGPMWADSAERAIVDNTGPVYPGLYVCGMAANAVHGSPRMGPIFGGMFLSGRRVAQLVAEELG